MIRLIFNTCIIIINVVEDLKYSISIFKDVSISYPNFMILSLLNINVVFGCLIS